VQKPTLVKLRRKARNWDRPAQPAFKKVGRLEGSGNAHAPKFDVMSRLCRANQLDGAAGARGMSGPTPIVLIMVGVGLGLFGLFGVGSLQY
jgi:hypothetical protein